MKLLNLKRIVQDGFTDFRRNTWLSVAAIAVMAVTLFVVASLFIARSVTTVALDSVQDKVDISVFFNLETSEQTILQIQRQVELLPEISSVRYIPPTEARDRFRELHKNEPLLLESIDQFDDEENPFPASFAIKVKRLEDYETIIALFEEKKFEPFVSRITDKQQVVDRLNSITTGIDQAGLGASLVFSLITVLVMFNTIRLTIYNRREEIEIMKLVGASNAFIRGPFIIEALLYAFAGTLISSVLIFPLFYLLSPKISAFLGVLGNPLHLIGYNIWWLLAGQIILGAFLGIVSSVIAMRRYLKI